MPKPSKRLLLDSTEQRILRRRFLVSMWLERGLPPIDPTAPIYEREKQAAVADRLRSSRQNSADILLEWVEENTGRRPDSVAKSVRSAASGDLAVIFTDVIGASVLRGYSENLSSIAWTDRQILTQQKVERIDRSAPPSLKYMPKGGQADIDGENFARSEEYVIGTFAKVQEIDEMDLVDDLLGLLTTIPLRYGQAAARLLPDLVYAVLLSNPEMDDGESLFSAAHTNLFTGALDGTNLDAATAKLLEQEEEGVKLNLHAKYLVVPPALVGTARKLVSERQNYNEDDLTVVSDSRLKGMKDPQTGEDIAGSDTTWYLAAGETDGAIELGFVNRDTPLIGSGPSDQGKWGVWYDVQMRVCARAVRPLSIVRYTAS